MCNTLCYTRETQRSLVLHAFLICFAAYAMREAARGYQQSFDSFMRMNWQLTRAIAALRGRWYVALHKRGGRLQRRQELPAEASHTGTPRNAGAAAKA